MTAPAPPDTDALARDLRSVRRLVRRLVRDDEDADDLAQEAWLASRRTTRPPGVPLTAWLVGIARRMAMRLARGEARRARREHAAARSEAAPSAADMVARAELHRRVVDAVLAVAEPYRSALLARFFEGASCAEIARRSGVPSATVRSHVRRGLALVRVRLDGERTRRKRMPALCLTPFVLRRTSAASSFAGALAMKTTAKVAIAAAACLLLAVAATQFVGPQVGPTRNPESRATAAATMPDEPAAPAVERFLRGVVRSRDVLRPVPGARVRAGRAETVSDASGAFRIAVGAADTVSVAAAADGFRDAPTKTLRPGDTAEIDAGTLWLEPLRPVRVLVRTRAGAPVSGARVEAVEVARTGRPNWSSLDEAALTPRPLATAETGADGRAAFADVPAGTRLRASKDGLAQVSTRAESDGTLVFTMGEAHVLEGRVLDARRAPVPGALVAVATSDPASARTTRADETGRYRVAGLERGDFAVRVARAGASPGALVQATLRIPDIARHDLVLRDDAILGGRVTAGGQPVAGAVIRVSGTCGYARAVTDSDGRYRTDALHEGITFDLEVDAPGLVLDLPDDDDPDRHRFALVAGRTTTRDFAMRRSARVEGRVTGPDGALPGARVTLRTRRGRAVRTAETGDDGRYAFDAAESGPARLVVERRGFRDPATGSDAGRIVVPREGVLVHDVALAAASGAGVVVSGIVESLDGMPIAGARVVCSGAESAATDSAGAFRVEGVPRSAPFFLWVQADGFETKGVQRPAPDADLTGIRVTLGRAVRVLGRATAQDGTAVRDADAEITAIAPRVGNEQPNVVPVVGVPVRDDGTFEAMVPWAGGGTVRVRVRAAGGLDGTSADAPLPAGGGECRVDVQLAARRAISGRVIDADTGDGVAGASVVDGTGAIAAVSDARGNFTARVSAAGDGRASLSAFAAGFIASDWARVEAAEVAPVVLSLQRERSIEGVVRFADGEPAAGVGVAAGREFATYVPGPRDQGLTDAQGRFRVPALARGQHALHVTPVPGIASDLRPFVTEPIEAGRTGVVLVAQRGLAIEGRVLDAADRPLAGILVTARAEDGSGAAYTRTRADGTFRLTGLAAGVFDVVAEETAYPGREARAPVRREGVAAGTKDVAIVLR